MKPSKPKCQSAKPQPEPVSDFLSVQEIIDKFCVSERHAFRMVKDKDPRIKRDFSGVYNRADLLNQKTILQNECLALDREEKDLNLEILKGEFESKKSIAEKVFALGEELKSTLQFHLMDQLPALNAGLSAADQRKHNQEVFKKICNRFQEFAKKWN